jgi:hypothetical protein
MFKNRMMKKIFVPKRDAATVNWRRLHNGEIYDLYSSTNIIRFNESRRMRGAGCAPRIEERRREVGKPEGKKSHGRHRRRRKNMIKNFFQEMGRGMDLIALTHDGDG